MIETLVRQWRGMAQRERRLVLVAGLVLLLAGGFLGLIEPALKGRANLLRELPGLRGQLAEVAALAVEARELSALPQSADGAQALRPVLERSVRAAGLQPRLSALAVNGELLELRFTGVLFAQWLGWLEGALRETRLRVADLSVTREVAPGVVTVRLVLEAPRKEPR